MTMKLISAVFAGFLGMAVMACGNTFVIDNFSCPDSVSATGPAVFTFSQISCPGSIGGARLDYLIELSGPSGSVSTINSNPPTGAITGTFGAGITGFEAMEWTGSTTFGVYDLNKDVVGDDILVQIKSASAGELILYFGPPSQPPLTTNESAFIVSFSGSPSYQDVLIPLTTPTLVGGTGANLADVHNIGLNVELDTPGATWSIDRIAAVPEPSALLLTGICFLGVLTRSLRRRSPSR
jgi:hypothetical protein